MPRTMPSIITNIHLSFQNIIAVSNELSDFHKIVITVMKMSFKKHSSLENNLEITNISIGPILLIN